MELAVAGVVTFILIALVLAPSSGIHGRRAWSLAAMFAGASVAGWLIIQALGVRLPESLQTPILTAFLLLATIAAIQNYLRSPSRMRRTGPEPGTAGGVEGKGSDR